MLTTHDLGPDRSINYEGECINNADSLAGTLRGGTYELADDSFLAPAVNSTLVLASLGLTQSEIADVKGVQHTTVKTQVGVLHDVLGTHTGPATVNRAFGLGILAVTAPTELPRLSSILRELVDAAASGLRTAEIGRTLLMSESTAKLHLGAARKTLGAHNQTDMITLAYLAGELPAARRRFPLVFAEEIYLLRQRADAIKDNPSCGDWISLDDIGPLLERLHALKLDRAPAPRVLQADRVPASVVTGIDLLYQRAVAARDNRRNGDWISLDDIGTILEAVHSHRGS